MGEKMDTGKLIGGLISIAMWLRSVGMIGFVSKALMFAAAEGQKNSISLGQFNRMLQRVDSVQHKSN